MCVSEGLLGYRNPWCAYPSPPWCAYRNPWCVYRNPWCGAWCAYRLRGLRHGRQLGNVGRRGADVHRQPIPFFDALLQLPEHVVIGDFEQTAKGVR